METELSAVQAYPLWGLLVRVQRNMEPYAVTNALQAMVEHLFGGTETQGHPGPTIHLGLVQHKRTALVRQSFEARLPIGDDSVKAESFWTAYLNLFDVWPPSFSYSYRIEYRCSIDRHSGSGFCMAQGCHES